MARAIRSLPLPVSPLTSTVASVGATRAASRNTWFHAALSPTPLPTVSCTMVSLPHRGFGAFTLLTARDPHGFRVSARPADCVTPAGGQGYDDRHQRTLRGGEGQGLPAGVPN